jgi:putative DNA methylase
MVIPQRSTSGGRAAHWRLAGRSCSPRWSMIRRPTPTSFRPMTNRPQNASVSSEIIEELVKWENSTNEKVLAEARAEILRSCDGKPPPVLDPFCGGGSIPLEAQRLGLEAHASDLNPVAVLITKALIEIPPKFTDQPPMNPDSASNGMKTWKGAQGLADDVRYYGRWMRKEAEKRIGHLYPKVKLPKEYGGGEATVIAWFWARTVTCENPACGGRMPLLNSLTMCSKKGKEVWLEAVRESEARAVTFEVRHGGTGPKAGSVGRTGATCLICNRPVPLSYVRAECTAGRMDSQLICVVAHGGKGRIYLPATPGLEQAAQVEPVPPWLDTSLPAQALGFRVQGYGITEHRELFTDRQMRTLTTFVEVISHARDQCEVDGASPDQSDAIMTYLALCVSRLVNRCSSQSFWHPGRETVEQVFGRNALPMIWVFAEANPFSDSSGNFLGQVEYLAEALSRVPAGPPAVALQADARSFTTSTPGIVVTDPPYYDNVPYADLSDFFYVWLRRCLRETYPQLFDTMLVPKTQELIAEPARQGTWRAAAEFFEVGLSDAFKRMLKAQDQSFPMAVFYAFKQAEHGENGDGHTSTGWETMLQGLLTAGFGITGTWPVRTEQPGGLREVGRGALASSIVLVCRPRKPNATLTTRRDFVAELKRRLPGALRNMQQGNIAPVDLAQASIGPGMGIFSAYSKVLEADGSPMSVRAALGLINQILDESLSELEADFDPNTRWAIAWFEQCAMNPGPFGLAETLS